MGSVTVSLYLRMDWTLEKGSEPPREVPNGTPRKGREECWMWATHLGLGPERPLLIIGSWHSPAESG